MMSVSYYSISRRGRPSLHAYSDGDQLMEKLAAGCLELAPPHHRWYLQTVGDTSIGFLFEDGYVYLAVVKGDVTDSEILKFLGRLRDGFKESRARVPAQVLRSLSMNGPMDPVAQRSGAAIEKATSLPTLRERPDDSGMKSERMEDPLLGISGMQAKRSEDYHQNHPISIDRHIPSQGESRCNSIDIERSFNPTSTVRTTSTLRRRWYLYVSLVVAVEAVLCVALVKVALDLRKGE